MQSASEVIAERLYKAGCRHAFGIPGGEVLSIMDALDRAGLNITLVKHENSGGFMAEGTWHCDGAPGILFATIGPGIANAANVIANAWQDRVPMIVLTGCVNAIDGHTYTHQVFDHVKFIESICKAAFHVESGTAGIIIDKAINIAATGRPGPVVLDIPMNVQRQESQSWLKPIHQPLSAMAPAGDELTIAKGWLKEAHRPIVLAGVDVLTQGAASSVARFCKENNVPLITTYKAKGVLDEAHPLALGGAGLSPVSDQILLPLMNSSDCVILAGYDPIEMRIGWRNPFGGTQNVIEISAEPNTHYMHQASMNFVGDIGSTLLALSPIAGSENHWHSTEISETRNKLRQAYREDEIWGPAAVVNEARKTVPPDTIATVDSGAHRIVLSHVWACNQPHGLLQSTALCTMGCAVPLAIGRKLAAPDRPVIAFVGDAGLEMFLGELATARDLKLGIPIIVFVDGQLGLIELKQRNSQMPNLGVDFSGTDFSAVASALGGAGAICQDRESLKMAIQDAFKRETFTLISAVIGRNAYDGRI